MPMDAKKFIDTWIARNISKEDFKPEFAKKYAFLCWKDADKEGFSRMNLDHATNDLASYIAAEAHNVVLVNSR